MEKNAERLQVIKNIEKAVMDQDYNRKVEIHDHKVTEEERNKIILKYDNKKRKIRNKAKTIVARQIADTLTEYINIKTNIIGISNAKGIHTGAIITSLYFARPSVSSFSIIISAFEIIRYLKQ